ncbi:MAG: hypothetical protein OHK0035_40420 [Cyanobacteria bacterium J069]
MKFHMLSIQSQNHLLNAIGNINLNAKVSFWMNEIWKAIAHRLTASGELQIRKVKTRSGELIWQIDDPITGYRTKLQTEAEVRIWLDQRFHQI